MPLPLIESEEQRAKVITQLSQLKAHPGWKLCVEYCRDLVALKKPAIFQIGGNEVRYSTKDILILEVEHLESLVGFPDKLIEELRGPKQGIVEDEDPFNASAHG